MASLTQAQRTALRKVARADSAGRWYRAATHGERVTLASLHGRQLIARRAWRGTAGQADAAYEYQLGPELRTAIQARVLARQLAPQLDTC